MAFVDWTEYYSVRNNLLDNQHQQLFDIINDLHQAIRTKQGEDRLAEVVRSLIDYTRSHFADEEKMMEEKGFPDYSQHKSAHQRLLQQVTDIEHKLHDGSESMAPDVLCFLLSEWLVKHIIDMDKQYTSYINEAQRA